MKKVTLTIVLLINTLMTIAQQSTIIDSKTMTVPRYTNLAGIQSIITAPQVGMMVYNNQTQSYWFYSSGGWTNLAASVSGSWSATGSNISNTNTGNVGIGTTSPTSKLNVNGQITIDQKNFGGYGGLLIKGNQVGSNYPNIVFTTKNEDDQDVNAAYIGGEIESNLSGYESMGLQFLTNYDGYGLEERIKIKANGNVGIGTSNPATAKLVIGGNPGQEGIDLASADLYANMRVIRNNKFGIDKDMFLGFGSGPISTLHLYSNNNETATIRNGFLGVGNNNPQRSLDVAGNGNIMRLSGTDHAFAEYYNQGIGGTRGGWMGFGSGGNDIMSIANDRNSSLYFHTNTQARMAIAANGNVGINDFAPSEKLTVNGKIKMTDGTQGTNRILTSDANGVSTWKTVGQLSQNFSIMTSEFAPPNNSQNNIPGSTLTFTAPTSGRIIIFPRVETNYVCLNPVDHCHLSWDFIPKINGSNIFTNNRIAVNNPQGVPRFQQVIAYLAYVDDRTLGPYVVNVSAGAHTLTFDIKLNTITPAPSIILNAFVQFIPN